MSESSSNSHSGIIGGRDPLEYDPDTPITLFLFQAVFIIALCQIIHIPLGYMRQPRVIAEVIAGILLGPTALGRIPNFTSTCFPDESVPMLTLVGNIGIIFFLFLVGLEVDVKFLKKNIYIALTVGLTNMAVPFGFGCLIAYGLFNEYSQDHSEGLKFTTFMVFIAVAMCITAFPVLARILTELRLLKERVGTIVLASGITNDVVGWMLLALSVTLANAGSGIDTLYILLVTIGWALFVIFPVRWVLVKFILRRDLKSGVLSRAGMLMIILMMFVSSFFTDIIGVHSIFGAFMVGLIVPREHGFVVDLTHKIEDIVQIIFIPIYFAIAGFNVDFDELNRGIDWGYVVAIIVVSMSTKIIGGFIGAKACGYYWRESLTVGVLMSCKGIVEIVVLNVGLNAGIISRKLFSMFVLMTLVCTFLTTPLTLLSYPVSYREKVQKYLKGDIDWEGHELERASSKASDSTMLHKDFKFNKIIYNVEDSEEILALLNFTELLYSSGNELPMLNVIFLKELTERTADLIDASHIPEDTRNASVLQILKKLFEYNSVPYVGDLVYYVLQYKTITYLETSDNADDFLIYAIHSDQVDSKLISELKERIIVPHFGLLLRSNSEKITSLSIVLHRGVDIFDTKNVLIVYLAKLLVNSGQIRKVIVVGDDEIDEDQLCSLSQSLRASAGVTDNDKLEFVIETAEEPCGFVIGPLNLDTLADDGAMFKENNLDALLINH